MQVKRTMRDYYTSFRMAKIKKLTVAIPSKDRGATITLIHC